MAPARARLLVVLLLVAVLVPTAVTAVAVLRPWTRRPAVTTRYPDRPRRSR